MANAKAKLSPEDEISRKLDVIIALLLRNVAPEEPTGDVASMLRRFDLPYDNIARIIGSPVGSLRELVSRAQRATRATKSRRK